MIAGSIYITGVVISYLLGCMYTLWINECEIYAHRISMVIFVTLASWFGVALILLASIVYYISNKKTRIKNV